MSRYYWLLFVILAGLSWGVYVPSIAFGGKTLRNPYASFLCVGVAYFIIAVLVPIYILWRRGQVINWTGAGVTFATLAGVAGAVGALCVIFASASGGDRRFIGPLIFGLAPIINTIVSIYWHPNPATGQAWIFYSEPVSWKFWTGIVLAGLGAFLVLYSKEEAEATQKAHAQPANLVSQSHPEQAPIR